MPQADNNEIPFSGARNRKEGKEVSDSAPRNFCQCPKDKRYGKKVEEDEFEFDMPPGTCTNCGLPI